MWHYNGNKEQEGVYISTEKKSKWLTWDINGKLIATEFIDGELEAPEVVCDQ